MGPSVGTGRGPGTWPSVHDGASAFVETAAVKTVTGEGPGGWRTVGAGSGAVAAVPGAVEHKMNGDFIHRLRSKRLCHPPPQKEGKAQP